jgi:ATP-binding cassette subfamily B protein
VNLFKTTSIFAKLKSARAQLPYIPDTFRLIWDSARGWTVAWGILLLVQGLLPIALVFLTGLLVDSIGGAVSVQNLSGYAQAIQWVVWIVLLMLLMQGLNSIAGWIRTVQAELVQDHIFGLIHAKAIELDLSFYDSPDYYDRLHRARVDAYDRPIALLENIGGVIQNSLTFVSMGIILLRFAWWMPIVLLIGMLPALGVIVQYTVREYNWRHKSATSIRRVNYYDWILTDRDAAAELRLFGLGELFRQTYQDIRKKLREERALLARSQAVGDLFAGLLALATMGGVIVWMIWRLVNGHVTLGDLAIFYQAFNQGQKLFQTLLGSVGQILRNILFIENLFEFLKLQPKQQQIPNSRTLGKTLASGIQFNGVSFKYPDSERFALQNFSLMIPSGQIAAIVGENGAGKSTVTKLLCRFYDPDAGQITIDGADLRGFAPTQLWKSITVLFQDPTHYHETAERNIAFGDLASNPTGELVISAGKAAGAHDLILRLPEGYQTILGKWFGGAELSGGEWQRVALARAFLRNAPIIILDEPTSAMDSWAEADWLSKFRSLANGRTVLLITHRFTTAMQSDMIHVMDTRRIIESGSHAELMAMNGKYAESWSRQMRQAEQLQGGTA